MRNIDRFQKDLAEQLAKPGVDELTLEQEFDLWKSHGDKKAHERLVLRLTPTVFRRIKDLTIDFNRIDDALSAGNEAVLLALNSWDPAGGTKLLTWVMQYVKVYIVKEMEFIDEFKGFVQWEAMEGALVSESDPTYDDQSLESDAGIATFEDRILEDAHSLVHNEDNEDLEREVEAAHLRKAIETLPIEVASIMSLIADGHDVSSAARVLRMAQQTASDRYHKGLELLREYYKINPVKPT